MSLPPEDRAEDPAAQDPVGQDPATQDPAGPAPAAPPHPDSPPPAPGAPVPRVSVIIPAYNRADFLARAVDSVLAQTFTDFELIVVDDRSTDTTREVMERYRDTPRVRLVFSPENRGGAGARNLGLDHARAALIAFQDSDDVWLPHKLAAQVAALDANPAAGLCYCGSLFSEGTRSYYIPEPVFERLEGDMSDEILRRNPTSTQTLVVRREILERTGPFDPGFRRFQDWELMIRIAQVTPILFLPEPMVVILSTPGNISSVSVNDAIFRGRVLEKYADFFARRPDLAARNHYIAARVWQRAGQPDKAAPHLKAAMKLQPGLKTAVMTVMNALPARLRPGKAKPG